MLCFCRSWLSSLLSQAMVLPLLVMDRRAIKLASSHIKYRLIMAKDVRSKAIICRLKGIGRRRLRSKILKFLIKVQRTGAIICNEKKRVDFCLSSPFYQSC